MIALRLNAIIFVYNYQRIFMTGVSALYGTPAEVITLSGRKS